jgi:uncharacterized membrane protein HdeD (DUF308 family)
MAATLQRNWWALLLRGIFAVLLGLIAFLVPGLTIAALTTLFGVYALIDGGLAIASAVRALQGHRRWGAFLLEGIVGLVVGILAIAAPVFIAATFITVLAFWAVVTGILEIAAAFRLRRHIQGEWLLILIGVVSILFGVILFSAPLAGAVALVWVLGGYELVFGILLIVLAFRLRRLHIPSVSGTQQPAL